MFAEYFRRSYQCSLQEDYRFYYDDLCEYGNPQTAQHIFYFIPGINGVPGQIRFALPALLRAFGRNIYIKCLYLDEFSAQRPVWEKYTLENISRRKEKITGDLTELAARHSKIRILVSSNGFYDFVHAAQTLQDIYSQLILYWVAAAPDTFKNSRWLEAFYLVNGITHNGYRWAAFPNHNVLRWINPEASASYAWIHSSKRRQLYKMDMESRFRYGGILWAYCSIGAFNACLAHALRDFKTPLALPAYILAATQDGYWQGKSEAEIEAVIKKYVQQPHILFRPDSHLWVVKPDNLQALLQYSQEN